MKTKKNINLFAIGASFVFMLNPNVNIVDVLPDFIGYIILCLTLTPLGDMNEYISDALNGFKRMIFIDAGKVLAYMWVFGISVSSEYNSSLMLWSFVFGVLEIIFVVPAYANLFKGLTGLGYFHENTAILGSRRNGKKNYTDKMRSLTLFFVIFKAVMSFLPELSDLTSTEYYENSGMTNLYQYIGVMRLLVFIPTLILGSIWFLKITLYFSRIRKDTEFCEVLEQTYARRVLTKKGIFVKRNVSVSIAVLITAAVLSFDFRIERVNLFPDFISAALLLAFFVIISKKTPINKMWGMVISAVYFVVSAVASFLEFYFFKNHSYGAILRDMEALAAYRYMVIACIVSAVVFGAVYFAVIRSLEKVIEAHTGYVLSEKTANVEMQSRMAEATQKEIKGQLQLCSIATVVYAISDVFYALFARTYSFVIFINIACTVFFVIMLVRATMEIYEAVNTKYMLE